MTLTDSQNKCMKSEFKKLDLPDEYFAIYSNYFSESMLESNESNGIDITGDPRAVSVSDDEFTAAYLLECVIEHSGAFVNNYYNLIQVGYSEVFARKYAEMVDDGCDTRIVNEIIEDSFDRTVREFNNYRSNLDNPAYEEVFRVAKKKGRTDLCAHLLSFLVIDEISLSKALEAADLYDSSYIESIDAGHSLEYSEAYAKYYAIEWTRNYTSLDDYAELANVFATSYEMKIKDGFSPDIAWDFSEEYADVYFNLRFEPFPNNKFCDYCLSIAEAKHRYRYSDRYSEKEYISSFKREFIIVRKNDEISIKDASEYAHKAADQELRNREPKTLD